MKASGTLIRRTPLTDTSLIVHWCTREEGIIKTVAKGARRPTSPFAGKLDLFYFCEVEIHPARSGDLHILKDLILERPRLGLRRSYLQTLMASYFVRLIDLVAEPATPVPDLADLLERGLDYLEAGAADGRAMRHFEKQLAEMLGLEGGGMEPAVAIGHACGSLPQQREELLERLRES